MGIEEAIREEYKKAGYKEGFEEAAQETKIRWIQRALQKGKYSLEEIADLFEVSVGFVQQVQKGEISNKSIES